ncbi:hypothetical protein BU26DRAFT_38203 [Trematosphaeria pertusa]|uniref:Uncharacterized protein n=1 Tax=Trematosphaeria pertusa TaxID=390896 RepID=A0A6A6J4P9_9PLEO|nr:uncharacterized protein BU26DRAFT_38203 [Trematosphaeria pertusa]KAF2257202.1 hypothetical protein BU26DRAFT_38203 [Trematosphaeria pertusa]
MSWSLPSGVGGRIRGRAGGLYHGWQDLSRRRHQGRMDLPNGGCQILSRDSSSGRARCQSRTRRAQAIRTMAAEEDGERPARAEFAHTRQARRARARLLFALRDGLKPWRSVLPASPSERSCFSRSGGPADGRSWLMPPSHAQEQLGELTSRPLATLCAHVTGRAVAHQHGGVTG